MSEGDLTASFRFGRGVRMRRRKDFTLVLREGRVASRDGFALYVLARPAEKRRVGIVCGRRVGGAVTRNRAKRRLREVLRTSPEFVRDGFWFVAVARPPLVEMAYAELRREMRAALAALTRGEGPACSK